MERFSKEHLQMAVEAAGLGVWSLDLATHELTWTARCDSLFGTPPGQKMTYAAFLAALHPGDRARADAAVQDAIRRQSPYEVEIRSLWPDGSIHWIASRGRVICDAAGKPVEMLGIVSDIEKRKQVEAEAARRAEQFEALVDEAPLGIFLVDGEFRLRQLNPIALAEFASVPNPVGADFAAAIHTLWPEREARAILARFRRTLATGEAHSVSGMSAVRRDHGMKQSFEWRARRIPLPDGDYGVVCYFRNILADEQARLARRESEAALRERERQFHILSKAAPAYLYRLLPDGTVDSLTSSFWEFVGAPADRIDRTGARLPQDTLHPEDVKTVRKWMREAVRAATPVNFEYRLRRSDGVYRWFVTHLAPEFDDQGRVLYHYGAAFEIHAQKEVEEALREADRRKDEFLAMLAHELRNPLAPIQMAAELVGRLSPDDPGQKIARGIIGRQVAHMTRLIEDLLDVSRLVAGKITLRKERLGLAEAVQEAVESCAAALEASGHIFACEVSSDLVVEGDRARLAQVVANLLSNAIKFTPPGGALSIRAKESGDGVELAVADTGIGIAAGAQSRIFELFAQEDASLERAAGGLGLGLTLVKRLVEMHDGTVAVSSAGLGKGAEFVVRLPRAGTGASSAARAAEQEGRSAAGTVILIVEDNADVAASLQVLLQLGGHVAYVARDGFEAIRMVAEIAPAVVFIDIGLPGIDGYEVARRLRADNAQAPVLIALSGYGQTEDKRNAREAGFTEHLTKPASWAQIESILTRYGAASQTSPAH